MEKEIRFEMTDGPGFLTHMAIEVEEDGSICLNVYKEKGVYAYARIPRREFDRTMDFLLER